MKIDESLLLARQGEELAERQLRDREVSVGRKPMAKHWPDEQESHTRQSRRIRKPRSLKSKTCPGGVAVYAAGISVKVGAHYPGRSLSMPLATGVVRHWEVFREVSRGHSSCCGNEGPNLKSTMKIEIMNRSWRQKRVTTGIRLTSGDTGRNPAKDSCECIANRHRWKIPSRPASCSLV